MGACSLFRCKSVYWHLYFVHCVSYDLVNKISHVCTFCLYGLKMVTVAFIWCFWCFNWFSYCRGKCICAGQGNTIVSHFVVQRGDFTVAIACVPCGPRRSLIYVWAWWFWVCWKLSAAEQVKTDCCHTPAVVSTLLTPLPVSCPLTTLHHYIQKGIKNLFATGPSQVSTWCMVIHSTLI